MRCLTVGHTTTPRTTDTQLAATEGFARFARLAVSSSVTLLLGTRLSKQQEKNGKAPMSSNTGDWLKLHRRSIDSQVFSDPHLWHLFCWCLLKTNWKDGWFKGVRVPAGSFATGRDAAGESLGMSGSSWYRGIKKLEEMGVIATQTNNRFTVISVVKWSFFQNGEQQANNERTTGEQQANNERTTGEQRVDTIEEGKKERREEGKKERREEHPSVEADCQAVVDYWNGSRSTARVRKLTSDRRSKLKARLSDTDWPWREAIDRLPIPNTATFTWQPDFDWLIANQKNAYSLAEGKYDRKQVSQKTFAQIKQENTEAAFRRVFGDDDTTGTDSAVIEGSVRGICGGSD
jgi:uncharacterized membrane protein